jgi:hypothetical protein
VGSEGGEITVLILGEEGTLGRRARDRGGGGGIRLCPGEEGSWAGPTRQ